MGSKTQVGESPHLKGGINEKGGIVRERRPRDRLGKPLSVAAVGWLYLLSGDLYA